MVAYIRLYMRLYLSAASRGWGGAHRALAHSVELLATEGFWAKGNHFLQMCVQWQASQAPLDGPAHTCNHTDGPG